MHAQTTPTLTYSTVLAMLFWYYTECTDRPPDAMYTPTYLLQARRYNTLRRPTDLDVLADVLFRLGGLQTHVAHHRLGVVPVPIDTQRKETKAAKDDKKRKKKK